MRSLLLVFLCWTLLVSAVWASSVDHPLLRILVRKGILTEEEAREVLKELAAEQQKMQREEKKEIVTEAVARAKEEAVPRALRNIKLGTLTYVDFSAGREGGEDKSRFEITRGYLNFKARLNPWLSFRLTPDVHREAGGDLNVRIKYAYAGLKLPDVGFLTNVKSEIGQGHFPWLDFEEHINPYRCQGTMPRERAGTFNSADVGVGVMGYFGGQLPADYVRELTRHYPLFNHYAGRFGSWHFGVYNGSGYHEK
ncbi:MAG: ATP synthase F0 subunit B, partial [Thermodesulfobacteria bacterium]|nr:ATP synthase F0 subunit B [Thermodesulfobacteriota bacterium]